MQSALFAHDCEPAALRRANEDATIAAALAILGRRMRQPGATLDSPKAVRELCALRMGLLEREEFAVLYMDAQHRLIEFRTEFVGTLSQTAVYPRELVRRALSLGAAAVILAHNHPSGIPEPSRADEHLTSMLKTALALVDVRVVDHIIVSGDSSVSFAERGLL